ncbi:hypothetical protein AAFF_G00256480 [Aldrovandia affinis]|uniref:Uncharacterized protein n=1 Tax=Aldrovandia affinis TaxID=143900 RepID=A0AAD7SSU6_9TELE|nr:hypothetical protein AAFF_G00256480 [Aldrovandia affinis]
MSEYLRGSGGAGALAYTSPRDTSRGKETRTRVVQSRPPAPSRLREPAQTRHTLQNNTEPQRPNPALSRRIDLVKKPGLAPTPDNTPTNCKSTYRVGHFKHIPRNSIGRKALNTTARAAVYQTIPNSTTHSEPHD